MVSKVALLALDGLSQEQFASLCEYMPFCKQLLEKTPTRGLISQPFVSPQPMWAELLTGTPWYINGCVGYARPEQSLNHLNVMTEGLLASPVTLIDRNESVICSNVPLLEPRERLWLADGSLPSLRTFSPERLSDCLGELTVKPRSYPHLAAALSDRYRNALDAMKNEENRMVWLSRIMDKHDWRQAVIRFSIFDQLQHLYGLSCFDDTELLIRKPLCDFLRELDRYVELLHVQGVSVAIASLYSHVKCRSRFNMNGLLSKLGYMHLQTAEMIRAASRRAQALFEIGGEEAAPVSLTTSEGRVDTATTIAYSPVAAAVFLNRKSQFFGGSVDDENFEEIRSQLKKSLSERLLYHFGPRAVLIESPTASDSIRVPEFIVAIEGVEFFDTVGVIVDNQEKPSVSHWSRGFILSTAGDHLPSVNLIEANKILQKVGFGQMAESGLNCE